jgi:hypothetical protein
VNEVLDRIERELTAAVRENAVNRRRRRSLVTTLAAGVAVLLTAGAGFAAVSGVPSPIERVLGSDSDVGKRPGTLRLDVTLTDPGGLRWTATTYLARNGTVSATSAPEGLRDRLPSVGGGSGFVIADNLLNGPLVSMSLNAVRARGQVHYLLFGSVDARARTVVVELGGERRPALLSSRSLAVPVEQPPRQQLTAVGRQRMAQMPAKVSVRSYAVAFTPDLLVGKRIARATVESTLADGTHRRQPSARYCVSRKCGVQLPRAG